ncbi:hypothetical protein ABZW30_34015 [Kitasatospora sp. NPDC004669]|uniref:hypothetical protein n=1 Tax=Kitasatospora sp. NPDC004669 TaxID=3154555 RepID=UPI0033B439BC
MQVVRRRRTVTTGQVTLERVYGVTGLRPHQAAPADLASWVRGHRGIENEIHDVRDTTYTEDAPPAFGREVPPPACAPVPRPG